MRLPRVRFPVRRLMIAAAGGAVMARPTSGPGEGRTMDEGQVTARRRVLIVNAHGLHLRPATKFVTLANAFRSEVRVEHQGTRADGKSILEMACLAAGCGTSLDLEARGPDAEEALAALAGLVAAGFYMTDEDYRQPPPEGPQT